MGVAAAGLASDVDDDMRALHIGQHGECTIQSLRQLKRKESKQQVIITMSQKIGSDTKIYPKIMEASSPIKTNGLLKKKAV